MGVFDSKQKQDDGSDLTGKIDEKDKRIEDLEEKVKELENNWKRALADYQNLVKRTQEDMGNAVKYSSSALILKLLDVLDHLEEAQKHLQDKGIELVIKIFKDVLNQEGVQEIESLTKVFDPIFHECVEMKPVATNLPAGKAGAMASEAGEKDNIIIEVLRKGYKMHEKVLRPAKVVVETTKM